jgi:hypothetical protein
MMMDPNDADRIKRTFSQVRMRQLVAIAAAVVGVLLGALVWRRPDLFGQFSKKNVMLSQFVVILSFINFTAWNWKCPSCKRYLGNDIGTDRCRKCGTRLV